MRVTPLYNSLTSLLLLMIAAIAIGCYSKQSLAFFDIGGGDLTVANGRFFSLVDSHQTGSAGAVSSVLLLPFLPLFSNKDKDFTNRVHLTDPDAKDLSLVDSLNIVETLTTNENGGKQHHLWISQSEPDSNRSGQHVTVLDQQYLGKTYSCDSECSNMEIGAQIKARRVPIRGRWIWTFFDDDNMYTYVENDDQREVDPLNAVVVLPDHCSVFISQYEDDKISVSPPECYSWMKYPVLWGVSVIYEKESGNWVVVYRSLSGEWKELSIAEYGQKVALYWELYFDYILNCMNASASGGRWKPELTTIPESLRRDPPEHRKVTDEYIVKDGAPQSDQTNDRAGDIRASRSSTLLPDRKDKKASGKRPHTVDLGDELERTFKKMRLSEPGSTGFGRSIPSPYDPRGKSVAEITKAYEANLRTPWIKPGKSGKKPFQGRKKVAPVSRSSIWTVHEEEKKKEKPRWK